MGIGSREAFQWLYFESGRFRAVDCIISAPHSATPHPQLTRLLRELKDRAKIWDGVYYITSFDVPLKRNKFLFCISRISSGFCDATTPITSTRPHRISLCFAYLQMRAACNGFSSALKLGVGHIIKSLGHQWPARGQSPKSAWEALLTEGTSCHDMKECGRNSLA